MPIHKQYFQSTTTFFSHEAPGQNSAADNIVCTEQKNTEILIMRPFCDWDNPDAIIWKWSPLLSDEIAPECREWFRNPSDCKCVLQGTHVLVVASHGAVALVRIADKKPVFYAYAGGNTHSAELLPDSNVISVSSTGNFIKLFVRRETFTNPHDIQSVSIPYDDAHGIVWDNAQQLVWVLGLRELTAFTYNGDKNNPALEKTAAFRPSSEDFVGHDLFPIPGTRSLYVSGHKRVLAFDTVTHVFTPALEQVLVKSISKNPVTGTVIIQTPSEQWWTDTIAVPGGETMKRTGAQFYKARWFVPNTFSYGLSAGGAVT